jgi:alpha-L-fucosidase
MMQSPSDSLIYNVEFAEPGDYKIILEYSCPIENSKQEGLLQVGGQKFYFETLSTGNYDVFRPLMFIQQSVAMITVRKAGLQTIKISPVNEGKELFKLSRIIVKPVEYVF